jgi:hypothetical protein
LSMLVLNDCLLSFSPCPVSPTSLHRICMSHQVWLKVTESPPFFTF